MAVGFLEFREYCNEQRIAIDKMIGDPTDPSADYDLLHSVYWAGHQLRCYPRTPLADAPLPHAPEEVWPEDTAARTLHHLINASFRLEPPPADARDFALAPSHMNNCSSADRAFAKLAEQLHRQMLPLDGPCIIHLKDGRPFIVQKGGEYGIPSGLTLEKTWIDAISYPAGSIVRVEYNRMERELWGRPPALSAEVRIRDAQAITALGFQRLSLFAFSLGERPELFDHLYASGVTRTQIGHEAARSFSISDVQQLAGQAALDAGTCGTL